MAVTTSPSPVASGVQAGASPIIPFRRATLAKSSIEMSYPLAADLGGKLTWPLPRKGYARAIRLIISGTETTSTADPTAAADWPWNLFRRITLRDNNGAALISLKGYNAYLAQSLFNPVVGRLAGSAGDTRAYLVAISSVATNTIAFDFMLPVETNTRDNLGAFANQNAAFTYTVEVDVETEANVVTTTANSAWALTAQLEYWYYEVPPAARQQIGPDGKVQQIPQATQPPYNGCFRMQVDNSFPAVSGTSKYAVETGRVYRGFLLVTRNSSGVRTAGIDRVQLLFGNDTALIDKTTQVLVSDFYRQFGVVLPTGVFPFLYFAEDGDGLAQADQHRDLLDTRALSQMQFNLTVSGISGGTVEIVSDSLVVPASMNL